MNILIAVLFLLYIRIRIVLFSNVHFLRQNLLLSNALIVGSTLPIVYTRVILNEAARTRLLNARISVKMLRQNPDDLKLYKQIKYMQGIFILCTGCLGESELLLLVYLWFV